MTLVVDKFTFYRNDFYLAFNVQIASDSDSCTLRFPKTGTDVVVTIAGTDVGTTGSDVKFNLIVRGNTLTVWRCTSGETKVIAQTSSSDIGDLTKLTIEVSSGTQISILASGCYAISPQAIAARKNRSFWFHLFVVLLITGGFIGLASWIGMLKSQQNPTTKP